MRRKIYRVFGIIESVNVQIDLDPILSSVLLCSCSCSCSGNLNPVVVISIMIASISMTVTKKNSVDTCQRLPSAESFLPLDARVVEWQTRTFEGRMPKGLRVQVPPRARFLSSPKLTESFGCSRLLSSRSPMQNVSGCLIQIVDFNQGNSRGVAYTSNNGGVIARL